MGFDGLLGVHGFVAHGHVDVMVTGDDLGDVRGQAVEHGVGNEHPTKVVRRVAQRLVVCVGEAGVCQSLSEQRADGARRNGPVLGSDLH